MGLFSVNPRRGPFSSPRLAPENGEGLSSPVSLKCPEISSCLCVSISKRHVSGVVPRQSAGSSFSQMSREKLLPLPFGSRERPEAPRRFPTYSFNLWTQVGLSPNFKAQIPVPASKAWTSRPRPRAPQSRFQTAPNPKPPPGAMKVQRFQQKQTTTENETKDLMQETQRTCVVA